MSKESTISIFVKQMRVNVRIGLHDFEKEAPQPLDVSIELFAHPDYLKTSDEASIIDYAKLHDAIKGWGARSHVELIETYLKELITLGFSFEKVTAVRASISKAEIFEAAQGAGLSAYIHREDWG
ncbi:MAG: dihydroneopterin aldolase [Pseudomonadota bacterium]